jgi:hypothetical protein
MSKDSDRSSLLVIFNNEKEPPDLSPFQRIAIIDQCGHPIAAF